MHALKIALFGLFGGSNFGNEASISALIYNLKKRFPNVKIFCIAPASSRVSEKYGLELIPIDPLPTTNAIWKVEPPILRNIIWWIIRSGSELFRFNRAKDVLSKFDMMVIPGTGIFDDFGQSPLNMPCHLLRWSLAARCNAAELYHVSVGAAEVKSRLSRILFRRAAGISTYRSFRDQVSKEHLKRTGFSKDSDPIYPDLAFSLPEKWLPPYNPVCWPPREIGVGVMGYYGWNCSPKVGEKKYDTYLSKLAKFLAWLLAHGYSVRLLTGDSRADEKPVNDLVAMLGSKLLNQERRLIYEPILSYHELLQQIASTDAVIATRYHNVLFSLLLERPVISVSYTDKNDVLLAEMGLNYYCQHIESLDSGLLIEQFKSLIALPTPPIALIRLKNKQFRNSLEEQYDRIFSNITRIYSKSDY